MDKKRSHQLGEPMWVKRCEHVQDAVPEVAELILNYEPTPTLIRIEGVDGAGKSTLATALASYTGGYSIHGDDYVVPSHDQKPYVSHVKLDAFRRDLATALSSNRFVFADSVCLGELAPEATFGRGFRIYVKRLSFNVIDGIWHGFDPHDPEPDEEIARSVYLYHMNYQPHENADAVVEIPEIGHTLRGPQIAL